jgi:hypothetical protein
VFLNTFHALPDPSYFEFNAGDGVPDLVFEFVSVHHGLRPKFDPQRSGYPRSYANGSGNATVKPPSPI